MKVFVVYCHPSDDSFTKHMCDLMLMEADLLDNMGLLGIVMDTLIIRARNDGTTFYDCYNHYERYTHPMQHDCLVVTKEAKVLWDMKRKSLCEAVREGQLARR